MTTHFEIQINETKTVLKVTFRDKKFRKLEHVRGKLSKKMMKAIGRILPHSEDDIMDLNVLHQNRVDYKLIVKEASLFTKFQSEWTRFFEKQTGLPPKFTGADGKALTQIIAYLKKANANIDSDALETWQVILGNYDKLDQWYKDNIDLKTLNSKLNVIIRQIQRKQDAAAGSTGGTVEL